MVDVKPQRRLADSTTVSTFEWTRAAVQSRGWGYEVASEPPKMELENVRFLAGYRRDWLFDNKVLGDLRAIDLVGATLGDAFGCCPDAGRRWSGQRCCTCCGAKVRNRSNQATQRTRRTEEAGMTSGGARVGVGTRFTYDGETVEVVEMKPSAAGNEVVACRMIAA